ncbi:MAG: N5-glutamine methyltransferase family protein [Candidatus Saccharimonadales bacterium]
MTIDEFISYATDFLESRSIMTARLDTLVLMEYVLNIDRSKLLSDLTIKLSENQKNVLNNLLRQRANHIPISYITHNKEFYGRNFFINNRVLEPRPESEAVIDLLKQAVSNDSSLARSLKNESFIKVADVGAGSGALGITASLEISGVKVDLIDIDKEALVVAYRNVVLHTITANLIAADLLPTNEQDYAILLANLPYVPDGFKINLAASHEPKIAIYGGKDGLSIYRKLFKLVRIRQQKPLYIITESLPPQHQALKRIANYSGYSLIATNDFAQLYSLLKR